MTTTASAQPEDLHAICERLVRQAAMARMTSYPEHVTIYAAALFEAMADAAQKAYGVPPTAWGLNRGLPGLCLDRAVGRANRRALGRDDGD
jgi:hypothetical protein